MKTNDLITKPIAENEKKYLTKQVIYQLRQKDVTSLELIYQLYYGLVYSLIYTVVGDLKVTRKLSQDVFVHFWQGSMSCLTYQHVHKLIYQLTYQISHQYVRNQMINLILKDSVLPSSKIKSPVTDQDLEFKEVLSDREYYIVVLTIIFGLTKKEIIEQLNIKEATFNKAYHRSLLRVAQYYALGDGRHFFEIISELGKENDSNG